MSKDNMKKLLFYIASLVEGAYVMEVLINNLIDTHKYSGYLRDTMETIGGILFIISALIVSLHFEIASKKIKYSLITVIYIIFLLIFFLRK